VDHPGPHPAHRRGALRTGDGLRVRHLAHAHRPAGSADHGARPQRTAGVRRGQLYTTLSVADAAAATAFIAGAEPQDVRARYEQAITDASVAVTRSSAGLTTEPMIELLGRVNAELAVYTGLVETAGPTTGPATRWVRRICRRPPR
jgi:hypothetical protein